MKDVIKQKSKAHIVYKTADGKRVPGTTTITGLLAKPFLIPWANKLGLEGIDSTKYRDEAAEVGTLAHKMIECYLSGEALDEKEYSATDWDLAINAVLKFYEWEKQNDIRVVESELPLVSEINLYGGTIDCICELDGKLVMLDFKTSKAIYDENFVQLAAYRELAKEHGYDIEECRVLRIGRDETEGFEERVIKDTAKYYSIFRHLLGIYNLKKELKWS